MEVEIDQREVGAQPVVVLGDAAISDLVEAEDALQYAEHMLHLGTHTGLTPVLLFLSGVNYSYRSCCLIQKCYRKLYAFLAKILESASR